MTGTEFKVFAFAGGLASVARLAHVLREGKPLSVGLVMTALTQGLIAGIIVGLLTWQYVAIQREAVYVWCALCGLAGFGGIGLLEFLLELFRAALKRGAEMSTKKEDE
jgi:UDP-N-acetylmuramyl pentapeptide phosphotransferase/UDP-N-acetylglucosamine-1-phosphate transferase